MAKRSQDIRDFILANVEANPRSIVRLTAEHFGISRQAVHRHIGVLIQKAKLGFQGVRSGVEYFLMSDTPTVGLYSFDLTAPLSEDDVWREKIKSLLCSLPENVLDLWKFSFTEMVNNAIDHSEGAVLNIFLDYQPQSTKIIIKDDGVGIFNKIQQEKQLADPRLALLELQKGKLTTAPLHHSGQGIFFTSRMCDAFVIQSDRLIFTHQETLPEDLLREHDLTLRGTMVYMEIDNNTPRKALDIYSKYEDANFSFTKTEIPVKMICEEGVAMSRSQAKRLVARIENFKSVILDFSEVREIGQGFADEIFRVFWNEHPTLKIVPVHANENVSRMIQHAILTKDPD